MIQIETKDILKELRKYKYDILAIVLKPKERNTEGLYTDVIVHFMKNNIIVKNSFRADISLNLDYNNFLCSLIEEFNLIIISNSWMNYIGGYGSITSHKNSIILVRNSLLSKIEFKLCPSFLLVSIFDSTLESYYFIRSEPRISLGYKDKLDKLFKNEEEKRYGIMYLELKFIKPRNENETMDKIINIEIEFCKEVLDDDILLALELEEN